MKNVKSAILVFVPVFVAIVGGVFWLIHGKQRMPEYRSDTTSLSLESSLPKNMEELVKSADLIVVGTVGKMVQHGHFYGYDVSAEKKRELDEMNFTHLSVPFTDFEIDVEHVLFERRSDGERSSVIFRIIDEPTSNSLPLPQTGDRQLFFLGKNPDETTYGISSFVHQINLDGPVASYKGREEVQLPFGVKTTPAEFIRQTEQTVEYLQELGQGEDMKSLSEHELKGN